MSRKINLEDVVAGRMTAKSVTLVVTHRRAHPGGRGDARSVVFMDTGQENA
jgi:hypothetical protein